MKLLLFTEYRLAHSQGQYWSDVGLSGAAIVGAYQGFSQICLVARIRKSNEPEPGSQKVIDERLIVEEIADYRGIRGFLMNFLRIRRRIKSIIAQDGIVLLRGCSPQNIIAFFILRKSERRFGYEAVGDPRSVFRFRSIRNPFAPILRWFFVEAQKKICREAHVVRYVTSEFLQRQYPSSWGAKTFGFSDIRLQEDDYVKAPRRYEGRSLDHSLIFIGSLEQLYKGPHILIKALKICRLRSDQIKLKIVGGGRYAGLLIKMAKQRNLQSNVEFLGRVSRREDIRACLDEADVFVLPSFTEGLPRAMIEAMARALPCIGTPVGGVGELLGNDYLVPPEDPKRLAAKIIELLFNPALLSQASADNLRRARLFSNEYIQKERDALIRELMAINTPG